MRNFIVSSLGFMMAPVPSFAAIEPDIGAIVKLV
jgi:hypothetical protein